MENKANYFFVGIFVFGVFFASVVFIFWFGGYSQRADFEYYKIRTKDSVSGLSLKAPVRLLGVEVGSVEKINIALSDDLEVDILIKVEKDTPIKEDTVATLELQGITGLKFIQLQGGSKEARKLSELSKDSIPVIQFKESFLTAINKQSEHIFSLVKTADDKTKELLSEKNLKNFEVLLHNLAQISTDFKAHSKILNENINTLTLKLAMATDEFINTTKNVNFMLRNLDTATSNFSSFFKKANSKFEAYDELRSSLSQNLQLLQILLLEGNRVLVSLQRSPSDIFFKANKAKNAPGE
ncbi:MlaD family protein [Campylobacter sp. MIT 21-1685]|uniref:MlaD family protein n=1 Tax=unclassified Campylobacter TaxID=2593542 RepID=UPI00224A4E6D|nr:MULTISPECIES: MlaD family protein [unclassified Campylobacter]MCX2683355.1 MlaD family protein [Campylobacter sp. MIT 21-1684]MCX2751590.1 MlaD family protein [Campylobacter sp. MIT 21-1682]MCX2807789.1 MlaD family protein [Campylobacter sp. MIT 21-1685]